MKKLRTKNFDSDVWIPLMSVERESTGEIFHPGYQDTDFCVRSILVSKKDFPIINRLEWNDLSFHYEARSCVETDGSYVSCDETCESIRKNDDERADGDDWYIPVNAIYPVLVQFWGKDKPEIWHLHQDMVIAFNLLQQGDSWVRPEEDYVEVARLLRNAKGKPYRLEIKNEFLKDYLCARQMGLYVALYRNRQEYFAVDPGLGWKDGITEIKLSSGKWWGSFNVKTDNGYAPGEKATIINARRTDVDTDDDVPLFDFPQDDCIESETKTVPIASENIVYEVRGEIWKYELVLPGNTSVRIRGDEPIDLPKFKVDASGKSVPSSELKDGGKWLWFDADVANAILSKKDSKLEWYTLNTGCIGVGTFTVDFGINDSGLLNVYAKDIAYLPEWLQKIWAGFNKTPLGGVSNELTMVQIYANLVHTQAPERILPIEYKRLNETFKNKYGVPLFNETLDVELLLERVNRFESSSQEGFFTLAKNLAKLVCDSVNWKPLQGLLPKKEKDWRSMRTLQEFLVQKEGLQESEARNLMAPFVGINDLRQTDAHIKGPDVDKAVELIKIDEKLIPLFKGTAMLCQFVNAIVGLNNVFKQNSQSTYRELT
ncbi:MAG: hypothetical protein HUK21_11835 [Fibrobacteraceae bacterium]|nr:hypothetical protein [Fibrobacteraceae bacterium]